MILNHSISAETLKNLVFQEIQPISPSQLPFPVVQDVLKSGSLAKIVKIPDIDVLLVITLDCDVYILPFTDDGIGEQIPLPYSAASEFKVIYAKHLEHQWIIRYGDGRLVGITHIPETK